MTSPSNGKFGEQGVEQTIEWAYTDEATGETIVFTKTVVPTQASSWQGVIDETVNLATDYDEENGEYILSEAPSWVTWTSAFGIGVAWYDNPEEVTIEGLDIASSLMIDSYTDPSPYVSAIFSNAESGARVSADEFKTEVSGKTPCVLILADGSSSLDLYRFDDTNGTLGELIKTIAFG